MRTSTSNRLARNRVSLRNLNRFALLGLCLLVVPALLFYGLLFFVLRD